MYCNIHSPKLPLTFLVLQISIISKCSFTELECAVKLQLFLVRFYWNFLTTPFSSNSNLNIALSFYLSSLVFDIRKESYNSYIAWCKQANICSTVTLLHRALPSIEAKITPYGKLWCVQQTILMYCRQNTIYRPPIEARYFMFEMDI